MLKGIDISHHQNGINIGATGVDFVIVKATEGNGYTDSCCDKLYQEAKRCGKKLGVYHFARPDLGNSAEAEADWFISQIQGYIKEAMLILDWERGNLNNPTWVKAFCDRVYSKTGVKPVVYMSASPANSYDWSSVANADYELWVANYGVNDGQPHEEVFNKYPLKYWSFYALWQYTSKGRVNGYGGNIDMNYFNGDSAAWDRYAGGSPNVTPSQPTPQPSGSGRNYINLYSNVDTWRIYPLNKTPKKGNEKGMLKPSKFGGLTYYIYAYHDKGTTAEIQTSNFGRGKIYIDKSHCSITIDNPIYEHGEY